jgi:hypothetical protein
MAITGNWIKKAKLTQDALKQEAASTTRKYGGLLWYIPELIRLGLDVESDANKWRHRPLEKQESSKNVYKDE